MSRLLSQRLAEATGQHATVAWGAKRARPDQYPARASASRQRRRGEGRQPLPEKRTATSTPGLWRLVWRV